MTAEEIQLLLDSANCYRCFGLTITETLTLGFYRQWLLSLSPNADTTAATLLESVGCAACFGLSIFDLLEIAFLNLIANAS